MADLIMNAGADTNYTVGSAPAEIALVSAAANIGDGTTITAVVWTLVCAPDGHAATLVDPTSLTVAKLAGATALGDYVLALVGSNDAAQTSEANYRDMPDSAVRVISVRTAYALLSVPSLDQKGYHTKVNAWASAIDLNHQKLVALNVTTGGNYEGNDGKLKTLRFWNYITGTYTLGRIQGGNADEEDAGVMITGDDGTVVLRTLYSSPTAQCYLRLRDGYAEIDPLLHVDTVRPFNDNAGVTAEGRGTHTFDLAAAIAKIGAIIENVADAGIDIDGVQCKDSIVFSRVGGASNKRQPVANLGARYLGLATPGTALVALTNEAILANSLALHGCWVADAIYTTTDNGDTKRIVITVEGDTILDISGTGANWVTISVKVRIFRTGANMQRAFVETSTSLTPVITDLTLTQTLSNRVYFGADSTVAGDIVLETIEVRHQADTPA